MPVRHALDGQRAHGNGPLAEQVEGGFRLGCVQSLPNVAKILRVENCPDRATTMKGTWNGEIRVVLQPKRLDSLTAYRGNDRLKHNYSYHISRRDAK